MTMQDRAHGGLGVWRTRLSNTAMLDKLVCSDSDYFHAVSKPRSGVWKAVLKARDSIVDGFLWRLGHGNASFWYANWCGDNPLCLKAPYVPQPCELGMCSG